MVGKKKRERAKKKGKEEQGASVANPRGIKQIYGGPSDKLDSQFITTKPQAASAEHRGKPECKEKEEEARKGERKGVKWDKKEINDSLNSRTACRKNGVKPAILMALERAKRLGGSEILET